MIFFDGKTHPRIIGTIFYATELFAVEKKSRKKKYPRPSDCGNICDGKKRPFVISKAFFFVYVFFPLYNIFLFCHRFITALIGSRVSMSWPSFITAHFWGFCSIYYYYGSLCGFRRILEYMVVTRRLLNRFFFCEKRKKSCIFCEIRRYLLVCCLFLSVLLNF